MRYQYDTISEGSRQIRLFQFQESETHPVSLSLQPASLDEYPVYSAISYVWGDTAQTDEILVNHHIFMVTKSLYTVLLKLKNKYSTPMWADAICINQGLKSEKEWQVKQMGSVFESASTVLIWLGISTGDSDQAMEEIERIGSAAMTVGLGQILLNDEEIGSLKQRLLKKDASGPVENMIKQINSDPFRLNNTQRAVCALLDRQSWHRAWIFQEVALSNQAFIHCGDKQMPIDHFDAGVAAIALYQEMLYHIRTNLNEGFPLLRPSQLNIRGLKTRRSRKQDRRPRLASLLFYRHQFGYNHFAIAAKDSRDLIFSALGIAGDTMHRPGGPKVIIKVDYDSPAEAVYTEATKSFLKSCEWYRLEYCVFPKDMILPSWVPDFKRIASQGVSCNPLSIWNLYQASKGKQIFEDGPEAGVLIRRGCRIDKIATIMEAPEWMLSAEDNDFHFKSTHLWLEAVHEFAQTVYPPEDLWRTLVADIQRYRRTNRTLRVNDLWKALCSQFFRTIP